MSTTAFIPKIWSARLLAHLDKAHVFKQVVNTDYQGDVTKGGSVQITQIGDITVKDYSRTSSIDSPENIDGSALVLNIDQEKYFNFKVTDVDQLQATPSLLNAAMERAAYALADEVDAYIAGLYTGAGTTITKTDIGHASGDNPAYDLIIEVDQKLNEKNASRVGRWMVVPPWMHAELMLDETYKQSWQNYIVTGQIPTVSGIQILMSNNLTVDTLAYEMLAGTREAISYAEQIMSMEAYRPESGFEDAVKGLHVYGAKVVQPNSLVRITGTRSTD